MIKRRSHIHKPITSSLPASALSFSWIPLTLILLLYTSGLCTGDTAKAEELDTEKAKALVDALLSNSSNTKSNYTKTGNPQIDWEFDPNLPRELNGKNLSDYPFFSRVPPPEAINFTCDGLKDGFYASVEYKCQVYHHCLFGTRYDFLCGNYTAFDQKTFICQFVSEVDCPNSALFFNKNDDLYWTTTEAPPAPRSRQSGKRLRPAVQTYFPRPSGGKTGPEDAVETPKAPEYNTEYRRQNQAKIDTSANYNSEYRRQNQPEIYGKSQAQDQLDESEEEYAPDPPRRRKPLRGRRRCKKGRCRGRNRPRARPRPAYYDYDDEYYDDDDYDDYENEYYDERPNKRRRDKPRLGGRKVASSKKVESLSSTEKNQISDISPASISTEPPAIPIVQDVSEVPLEPLDPDVVGKTREEIFTKSRPPPRIRPPVPKNERNKYDAMQGRAPVPTPSTTTTTTATQAPKVAKAVEEEEYYDDDYQQQSSAKPKPTTTSKPKPSTTAAPTTLSSRQKFVNRNFRQSTTSSTTPFTTSTTTTVRTTPSTTTTKVTTTKSTTAVSTTTTTEAPQYDYEYEYEDELPPLSSSTERSTTTASTTTTTTTPKPSRNNFRGNKRPSSLSSVQTSTSVTVNEELDEIAQQPLEPAEAPDASQNAINRRRSSWNRNQSSKSSTALETTPNSISSTSERFQTKSVQRGPPQAYQEPVITVKSAPPSSQQQQQQQSRSTEPPVSRIRPSRFWQRPAKVVASTISSTSTTRFTTTEAPIDYADYQDQPETASVPATRYNSQKSGSSVAYRSPQVSGNSEDPYSSSPQYTRTGHQYTSNNNNNNNNQFLRQTQGSYRSPPQTPARVTIDPSNYVSQYQTVDMTSSMRPEFISLLRDDEGPYYDDPPQIPQQTQVQNPRNSYSSSSSSSTRRLPPQRPQYFGNQPYHQTTKNLYGAAQESYPTFVNPPPRFNTNAFMNSFRYPMMFAGHGI